MKKISAFTMVEMTISLLVVITLSSICISLYKPNFQKARVFLYAIVKNLGQANIAIEEKNDTLSADNDPATKDWYCLHLADLFSLKTSAVCDTSSSNTTVNLSLSSNVDIMGVTNSWVTPYDGAEYKIKNILVDFDGTSRGKNTVGIDRFPLRIYDGGQYTGNVLIVDCANDVFYDIETDTAKTSLNTGAKSPYCPASSTNLKFTTKSRVLGYDVYRAKDDGSSDPDGEGKTEAISIASGMYIMEGDCAAYGGTGFYSRTQCGNAGFRIAAKCATTELCESCTSSTCPLNASGSATDSSSCATLAGSTNPSNLPCFTTIHKPSGGTTFMLETLVGQIDI